jgi:L-seryl-tRNA(Ser) seleniumtransferase
MASRPRLPSQNAPHASRNKTSWAHTAQLSIGSGTILNTGLGRAKLALAQSKRSRQPPVTRRSSSTLKQANAAIGNLRFAGLLCELTGAEAALVVNNNAAAVMIAINTFAVGKEVLLSRPKRGNRRLIPNARVVRSAGAILVDVGTTNKTRLRITAGGLRRTPAQYFVVTLATS